MYDLFKAITEKYDQTADLKQALSGGLYNTEAPQNAEFPYGTFQLITRIPDHHASDHFYLENCLVQFSLFSKNLIDLCNIQDIFVRTFDFCNLTMENFELISCVRESLVQLKVEKVWQFNSDYRLYLYPKEAGT